jgi:hypothetical protein
LCYSRADLSSSKMYYSRADLTKRKVWSKCKNAVALMEGENKRNQKIPGSPPSPARPGQPFLKEKER